MSTLFDDFGGLEPKSLESILRACRMPTPEMVPASTYKDVSQVPVSGLAYDSRRIKPGDAYFAISGAKFDGNVFIDQAIADGASCIFTARQASPEQQARVPIVVVDDVLKAQAAVANALYDTPSSRIRVLGVTGTNGKTTTTHLIERIFNKNGKPCGLIGTLGARIPQTSGNGQNGDAATSYLDMHHTTPQPADLQAILYAMAQSKVSHVAMEVSSHALSLGRVLGTRFAGAALTNITQDHLDFHKTMEHYAQSKKKLFEMIDETARANEMQGTTCAINLDDEYADMFLQGLSDKVNVLTYGFAPQAAIRPKRAEFGFDGMRLSFTTTYGDIDFHTPLTGRFNLYNIMTAMALALGEGIPLAGIAESLQDFAGVSGRFESVSIDQAGLPLCLVDYAHTPDGLENVLKAGRQLVPDNGRLIIVFGCGGDRDSSKRPQMGRLAETLADIAIITSDNPRTEEPDQIIADILAGIDSLKDVLVEQDRSAAIDLAIQKAGKDDVVIVAGKGHETYQILKDRTIDFDDRLAVKNALKTKLQKR